MRIRNIALAFGGAIGAAVAVKMLTRAATVAFEEVAALVPHSDRSRFVNVDGMRIHYQEFGGETDPPVILIHGYTASAYVWRLAAPRLAEAGLRVLALDLVGFGYSDKPRAFDYTIASQARIVTRFMDRLGIGRATLVGSSYGGAVAATIALDEPARVEKLVLVSAVCNDDLKHHPILRLVAVPAVGELLTPFLADSRLLHRFRMRDAMSPANHHLATEERIDAVRRPLFAADGHHSLLATSRNWDACRIEQDAHLIAQPTLIIWGEDDKVVPIRNGYKLHSSIPDSRLVVLTNCGHLPHEERSELFTQFVAGFCK
jgi:pimeloyl-ACP methyl ester carboxylesterase